MADSRKVVVPQVGVLRGIKWQHVRKGSIAPQTLTNRNNCWRNQM